MTLPATVGEVPDDVPVNEFMVAGTGAGNEVIIARPPMRRLSQAQAIRFAAWLAVMADDPDLERTAAMVKKVLAT